VRIDKYLWSIRVFKTRSKATEACRKGKVLVQEKAVKPSRETSINEVFVVKKKAIAFQFQVKDIPKNRVGPKLVADFVIDITPQSELDKMEMIRLGRPMISSTKRKFKGRPTKKERRDREKFLDDEE